MEKVEYWVEINYRWKCPKCGHENIQWRDPKKMAYIDAQCDSCEIIFEFDLKEK